MLVATGTTVKRSCRVRAPHRATSAGDAPGLALALAACRVETLFPDDVAAGVARLTVRNAGTLVSLLERDETCGFANAGVRGSPVVEGEPGREGQATWTVTGCTLDFGEPAERSADCAGTKTLVGGRVTVSATRTVRGIVTGNAANPVVPERTDAVALTVSAAFEGFEVASSAGPESLRIRTGTLEFGAVPQLAVSASRGVCAVATANLALTGLRYSNAVVHLDSGERAFDVEVPASALDAHVGRVGDRENLLVGELTVWNTNVKLPHPDGTDALEPDYDVAKYEAGWSCAPDLLLPVSTACPPVKPRVAQGAAQLTVNLFGQVTDVVDRDTRCGFASDGVEAAVTTRGTVGARGGSAPWTLASPCELSFAEPTVVSTNCLGLQVIMQGKVRVTGTKTVRRLLTGDPAQPIIPTSRDPAELQLSMVFDEFIVTDSTGRRGQTARSGTLTGRSMPRTALDADTGACSLKTPVAQFPTIAWADAALVVKNDGSSFAIDVSSAALVAQNGPGPASENHLSGVLIGDGEAFTIPVGGGAPVLDPAYDAAILASTWTCPPNLRVPASDAECAFERPLAEGAARLLVQLVGSISGEVNADDRCGFATNGVLLAPERVEGGDGEQGLMAWKIDDCAIEHAPPRVVARSCTQDRTCRGGRVTIDARRTVTGRRKKELLFIDSITPNARNSVRIDLLNVDLANVSTYSVAAGASAPESRLTLHVGRLAATVLPILGERRSEAGVFDVPTPVASLTGIVLTGARATLESEGKTFLLDLPGVRLAAFNGSYQGASNSLEGTVTLGASTVELGALKLDPAFTQAAFDASYACTGDLRAKIAP